MIGTPLAFTVEATGDDLQFLWQKDGKDINKNEPRLQCSQTDNTSTLHIQHVKKIDQGHYRCIVKNPIDKSGTKSDVAEITVREFFLLSFFVVLTIEFSFHFGEVGLVYYTICVYVLFYNTTGRKQVVSLSQYLCW